MFKTDATNNIATRGIVGQGNELQGYPRIDSVDRVLQLTEIVFSKEIHSVLGFVEDDEKILAYVQSSETRNSRSRYFTFTIKKSPKLGSNAFTVTNKTLFELKHLTTELDIFGHLLPYSERQKALNFVNRPKDTNEILKDFLESTYERESTLIKAKGGIVPDYTTWKDWYISVNTEGDILNALIESPSITSEDKDLVLASLK